MVAEDFKRKLTAILSSDVVGYSRLLGEDEAVTVKTPETLTINPIELTRIFF
jgi:hypothetical protein